jgi:hypothetical protein
LNSISKGLKRGFDVRVDDVAHTVCKALFTGKPLPMRAGDGGEAGDVGEAATVPAPASLKQTEQLFPISRCCDARAYARPYLSST